MPDGKDTTFEDLEGKIISDISGCAEGSEQVRITTDSGVWILHHEPDCCESVSLAEIHGDPSELIGGFVSLASESSNSDGPPPDKWSESWTWTFYRLVTDKGTLVMRWLGESNGYYSEFVDLAWEALPEEGGASCPICHNSPPGHRPDCPNLGKGSAPDREQQLEAEVRALDAEIGGLQDRRKEVVDELLALRSPHKVGDIVEWDRSGKTWRGQIDRVGAVVGGKPISWRCVKFRKDGSPSDVFVEVFNPRAVEPEGGAS